MADLNTSLYASQGNGGSPRVLISEVAALASTGGTPATTTTYGVVKEAAHQADSVAATLGDLVIDFNALLAKLQAAGLMA